MSAIEAPAAKMKISGPGAPKFPVTLTKKNSPQASASIASCSASGAPSHAAADITSTASVCQTAQRSRMPLRRRGGAKRPKSATSTPSETKPIWPDQGDSQVSGSAMAAATAACSPASAAFRTEGWRFSTKLSRRWPGSSRWRVVSIRRGGRSRSPSPGSCK